MIARVAGRLQDLRAASGRGPVLPTRRGTLLLGLGAFLYGAGANVSSGWTLLMAAGCLGAVGWSWYVVRATLPRLRARRELPPVVDAGAAVDAAVVVEGAEGASVLVADPVTGLVGVLGGSRTHVRGAVALSRGRHGGDPLVLRCTDPLGLAGAWRHQHDDLSVLALPTSGRHLRGRSPARGRGGDRDGDAEATNNLRGPELVGLREHLRGEPLGSIHWRASARRGELVLRDTRQTTLERRDVVLAPGLWDGPRLDLACALAVEIAEAGAVTGRPVTICADGARLPWGPAARAHLAELPPAAGLATRPLRPVERDPEADQVDVLQSSIGVAARGAGFGQETVPVDPSASLVPSRRTAAAPVGEAAGPVGRAAPLARAGVAGTAR